MSKPEKAVTLYRTALPALSKTLLPVAPALPA